MNRILLVLSAVLVLAWVGGATVTAKEKDAAKADKAEKGDKEKGKKADAPKAEAKPAVELSEAQQAVIEKEAPEILKVREEFDSKNQELADMYGEQDPKEKKKIERKIPAMEKKLKSIAEKLTADCRKASKPYEDKWKSLKEKAARLTNDRASAETAKQDKRVAENDEERTKLVAVEVMVDDVIGVLKKGGRGEIYKPKK